MGASAKTIDRNAAIASALRTVATERTGLAALSDALGDGLAERFADAVETLAGIGGVLRGVEDQSAQHAHIPRAASPRQPGVFPDKS